MTDDWAATCGVLDSPPDALLQLLQEELIVLVRCLQSCTTALGAESLSPRTDKQVLRSKGGSRHPTHMATIEHC